MLLRTRPLRNLATVAVGLGLAMATAACERKDSGDEAATATPAPQSTEWATENPTEPAVPVQVPDTPMTNVPVEGTATASPAPNPT